MGTSSKKFTEEVELDLLKIFEDLWANKFLILLTVSFMFVLGVYYAHKLVPQYQSSVLLQIESSPSSANFVGELTKKMSLGNSSNSETAVQIALIKSRFILRPVVQSLGLNISAIPHQSWLMKYFAPSHATIQIEKFDVMPDDMNKSFDLIFDKLNHYQLFSPGGRLLLQGEVGKLVTNENKTIQLLISSVNAPLNTRFLVRKISDLNVIAGLQSQLKISDLGENGQRTGVLELTLRHPNPKLATQILNAIAKTIQIKDIEKNAAEASKVLEFLYKQLPITKQDLEKSEERLNYYRAKMGKIDIKLQSQHLLMRLDTIDKEINSLRIDKIDKLERYTRAHPFIIAINTKLMELKTNRGALEAQLKKLPSSDQVAVNLMRDVKVKNTLYTLLLNKIQELEVAKAGVISNVRLLSLATLPREPLPVKSSLIYLGFIFFGLMLSIVVIMARKLMFPRVVDPHWSERKFDLLNLAIIPYTKEQSESKLKGQSSKECKLLAHTSPRNLTIESLRSLRTTLQIRLNLATNNIVAILGVSPGVGKSFVSVNLAYLLATTGKRVLLIDTDLRKGTVHKYFGLSPSPGVAEVLNNQSTLDECLASTIHPNLTVFARGNYPADPSELLTREYFKELLLGFSQQYDFVVIDTPPVLLVTDAVLISALAGTNYLVVGANAHQPAEIEMSIKKLTQAGITLNGSIFNFYKNQLNRQSYGYNYSYYHDTKAST